MCKVGVIFDDSLGDKLQVTVIAAGFEDSHLPFNYESPKRKSAETVNPTPAAVKVEKPVEKEAIPETPTNSGPIITTSAIGVPKPVVVVKDTKPEPEDPTIMQRLIDDIINNRYTEAELNKPAYKRQNVRLFEKPDYAEEAFLRINLDKTKR